MAKKLKPAQILAMHKGPKSKFTSTVVSDAATELGTLGGIAGGPARASKLKPKHLTEIARHAANVRWGKECDGHCRYC